MISATVITFNEAQKLIGCLESLKDIAHEIVVVDLGSKDETLEIAKKYGAKILTQKYVPYVELIRNYAISKASGDWILILDPDERIPHSLAQKLMAVSQQDQVTALNIPRKNIFFGCFIAHSNWWPDKQIRFFKKGKVLWQKRIHAYPKVFGKVLDLETKEELAIIHYGYDSVTQFIERQNRYSTAEAQNRLKKGERFSFSFMIGKPVREFLVRFVKHRGFLDGFYGLALLVLMMIYQLEVSVKMWEMERKN